jgi:hypothetical protein
LNNGDTMNDQPRAATGPAIRTGLLACILGLVLVLGSSFAAGQAAALDGHAGTGAAPRFKAIAFDYLVLFNADSVVTEVERVFPGRGVESPISGGPDSSNTAGSER